LIGIILDSNDYEDLEKRILERGIRKERYKDFLAEIKQDLKPIEDLRNCIAHSRSIERNDNYKMIVDYANARDRLKQSIVDFWVNIKND